MGIKINQILTMTGGGTLATGSVIAPTVKFHRAQCMPDDEEGNPVDPERIVEFQLPVNKDKATYKLNKNDVVNSAFKDFPSYWLKPLTPAEYALLSGTDALLTVETWLKDYLVALGVTAVIEDLTA